MNSIIEYYKAWQPDAATFSACLPEIALVVLALLVLVFDVVCKGCGAKRAASGFVRAVLIALFICVVGGAFPRAECVAVPGAHSLFGLSEFGVLTTPVFIACAFFAINLSSIVRSRESNAEISAPATAHLILIATAAASLLTKATNFVAFFVLLETLAVCLYALVGSNRRSAYSLEAGVKYLIAGGVSGALMLFGIVLLYGNAALVGAVAVSAGHDPLSYAAITGSLVQDSGSVLGLAGAGLVLAGVMFKLGVFPMQFWIPDVYQGAPTHVTFFLATLSKATGFCLMFTMLSVFYPLQSEIVPVLLLCTLISIVYANVTALGQRNVKRLLGLSGVSHAGYLTLGLLAFFSLPFFEADISPEALRLCLACVVAYLIVYIATVYPIFSVMARMPQSDDALQNFDDYENLNRRNPFFAGTLAFGLGSLAGIPPTVGFIAKLGILYVLFRAGFYGTIAVMLACVVAGIYYYFGWFRAAFSAGESEDGNAAADSAAPEYLPVGICSRVTLTAFSALMILGSLIYWFALR